MDQLRNTWAGQLTFSHRSTAASLSRTTSDPQEGQTRGSGNTGFSPLCSATATTSGMISPALRTVMISLTANLPLVDEVLVVEHCTADGGARQGYGFKPGGRVRAPVRPNFDPGPFQASLVVLPPPVGYLKAASISGQLNPLHNR